MRMRDVALAESSTFGMLTVWMTSGVVAMRKMKMVGRVKGAGFTPSLI